MGEYSYLWSQLRHVMPTPPEEPAWLLGVYGSRFQKDLRTPSRVQAFRPDRDPGVEIRAPLSIMRNRLPSHTRRHHDPVAMRNVGQTTMPIENEL